MNVLIRAMLALVLLLLPMLGMASEPSAQRGAPIAEFLDAQGRLRMPEGYSGSLDPKGYRMVTEAGQGPKFVAEATPTPQASDSGLVLAVFGIAAMVQSMRWRACQTAIL